MSMTTHAKEWHKRYEELDTETHLAIDCVFNAAFKAMRIYGLASAVDDRAETLVAAITEYVLTSRE